MTQSSEQSPKKLIHVARIFTSGKWRYLFLKKNAHDHFVWIDDSDSETEVSGQTVEDAMRMASRHWKQNSFTNLQCGFRYTLPERDEHGINALFHQMGASFSSGNGIYYDEELGNNCSVQNASDEAVKLFRQLNTK